VILLFAGTPGIGKTTIAGEIKGLYPETSVHSFDEYRTRIGVDNTKNPVAEDAINWRIMEKTVLTLRKDPTALVIIDSQGISRRLPMLRYALGEHQQRMVRLTSSFPYALCRQKWQDAYSQAQFDFYNEKVMSINPDYDIRVDGKTPLESAREILALL